jgi:hypothetical protein
MNPDDEIGQAVAREIGQTIARKIATGIALFLGFLFFIAFGGVIVRELWNWLLPDIFGLRRITLWEALGLLALSRILFGSFGMKGSHGRSEPDRCSDRHEWWKASRAARANVTQPPATAPEA